MPGQKSDVVRVIPAGAPTQLGENHFINCFSEALDNPLTQVKRAYCVKRKGLKNTLVSKSDATGEARGVFYWSVADYTFMVYGNTVYAYSSSSSTVPAYTVTLATSTGPVGFIEVSNRDAKYVFFCDGQDGYLVQSTALTTVITIDNTELIDGLVVSTGTGYTPDGTYTSGTVTGGGGSGAAFSYVVSGGQVTDVTITNKGTGYTSAPTLAFPVGGVGQPSAGSGANYTAVLSSFPVPHIPQPKFLDGYILLAKENSTEIWNSGLGDYEYWASDQYALAQQYPGDIEALAKYQNYVLAFKTDGIEYFYNNGATASPLQRTTQAATMIAVGQPGTVQELEDDILFVGKGAGGGFGVWNINNFKEVKISPEYIDEQLNEILGLYNPTSPGKWFLSGFVIRVDGHKFYVINEVGNTKNSRALVYDVEDKLWSFWDSSAVAGTRRYIGVRASVKNGVSIVQTSGTKVMYHSTTTTQGDYNDDGTVYYSYYNTPVIDMDNRYRKRYNRIEVIGNKYPYSNPVTINYSDSNAESIDKLSNTSWTVNMQTGLQSYLNNLGQSRSRIWQIGHSSDAPFKFENIELFYMQGEH